MKTTILVLAKSIKKSKYCVAGKNVKDHSWIRPVSTPAGAELSGTQCICVNSNGNQKALKPLQKVEIKFTQHEPLINQPENWVVSGAMWKKRSSINKSEIINYLDQPNTLWGTGDRVKYDDIKSGSISIVHSLYLVQVENLRLLRNYRGSRRARFEYANIQYDLAVTDPNFDKIATDDRRHWILCISLGEKYKPTSSIHYSCFKIVAAIY